MNSLDNLPEELQSKIFKMVYFCKKESNFYINKQITNLILKDVKKCQPCLCLGKYICKECHKDALKFMNMLTYTFI